MEVKSLNLMTFLTRYFKSNHCHIINEENNFLKVKLTEDMDRVLMNRPFYWQYIKAIGQQGEPLTLSLQIGHTKKQTKNKNSELIHFGSPRLHTIFNELSESARFTRLFEEVSTTNNTTLYPWLVMNVLVAYEGKQKKEQLFSIGLQLINGTIVFNMMEQLNKLSLDRQISNYCYTISPLIKLESGFKRIQSQIEKQLQHHCYKWADESLNTLHEEIQLIKYFYNDQAEAKKEEKEREINQAKKRYLPIINITPFSGGLFYLTNSFLQK